MCRSGRIGVGDGALLMTSMQPAGKALRWCPCRAQLLSNQFAAGLFGHAMDHRKPKPVPLPTPFVVKNGSMACASVCSSIPFPVS